VKFKEQALPGNNFPFPQQAFSLDVGGTRSLANEKLQITGSRYIIVATLQYGRDS
jgi:hypothetical protein